MKLEAFLASPKVTAVAMEQRYADLYARALRTRRNVVHRVSMGRHKAPHTERFSDLMFKLQEAARDFFYRDPALIGSDCPATVPSDKSRPSEGAEARPGPANKCRGGWTIIAGSPYFDQRQGGRLYNWGRDTMVALPGLCLERERFDLFRDIMKSYLRFVRHGILPNMVGDGSRPRYNSIDASLWMFWAVGKYLERTEDYAFLGTMVDRRFHRNGNATVRDILEEVIDTYRNGIRFEDTWQEDGDEKHQTIRIFMDGDCLLSAGNENTQLTWMDVKPRGCRPVTSRHGKAVEVNALWYNALRVMQNIQERKGRGSREYAELAEKVKSAFIKFWNPKAGCLYDTIDGDPEQSRKIRPNQVFAVAFGLLDANKSRAVMGKVRQELLTPFGLRTLSPHDADYRAVHHDEYSYHQGTVWPWLIGAFIEGSIVAYGKPRTLRILDGIGYFWALSETLETFGSVPEVFDGGCDSVCRHGNGKGCNAQAWNVGESLRSLSLLLAGDDSPDKNPIKTGSKIVYEMVIRDYYDGGNHVSGLCVALQELPFLAESGVEYVYLLGLMKHNGSPFGIIDPFDIDHRAGSFADLNRFVSEAHRLGMKVIADWVANQHVSKNSPLCKAHPDWFLYTDAKDGDYFADKSMQLCAGRHVHTSRKNLVLVSATDEVPARGFPRRWSSLAQPDLSHPEVRTHALEIGRFWLAKGLDGFRIDAALSAFPDKIKENWGLDVEDNLTRLFIEEARRIKPDCFIMFEGFERLEELLQLADYENCAVYDWRPRNLTTDALRDPAKLPMLMAYLKQIERAQPIREELVNLGPEHDAFDFEDPWAKLDYTERSLLYFLYAFMPGYMLVFNGQLFGKQHAYKRQIEKTRPAPRVVDAVIADRETGKKLFGLRKEYPQLVGGDYRLLENGRQDVICLARFDEGQIVIGVINIDSEAKEVVLSLSDIMRGRLNPSDIEHARYTQDALILTNNAEGWMSEARDEMPAEKLLREGLAVAIAPRSCQVIRLRVNA